MNESAQPTQTRSPHFQALCAAIADLGLDFHPHPTGNFVVAGVRMTSVSPVFAFSVSEHDPVLKLKVILPLVVPEERRAAVGEFLHALNCRMEFGCFRIDPDDGELQFGITHDFGEAAGFPGDTLKRMTLIAQTTVDGFFPAIAKVIYAGMNPVQALEQGEAHYFRLRGCDGPGDDPGTSE